MHIRQLETLIAIDEKGGFRRAASALNMTPSAVSMQMRALETELNAELFDRRVRPPALNSTARAILQSAREIAELQSSIRRIAHGVDEVAGQITLGVIPTASITLLPAALVFIARHYPKLQVRVTSGLSDDLILRLLSGEVDAALVTEPTHLERKLRWETVLEERLVIACHKDIAARPSEGLLSELPFIRFSRDAGIGRIIDRALRARRIRVVDVMELDSVDAIVAMVSHGHGTAIVPEHFVQHRYQRGISTGPFGSPPLTRRIALAMRLRSELVPFGNALLEGLRETVTRIPGHYRRQRRRIRT